VITGTLAVNSISQARKSHNLKPVEHFQGRGRVDEERMRPGHGLGSVPCVSFGAVTLLVGWKEGHLATTCTT